MAVISGLFNSRNGDRKYDAIWFARYFSRFIGDGVFPNPSTGLQIVENEGMITHCLPGDGWIKGYFLVNDSNLPLTHDVSDGVLNRIDRVVMQLNFVDRQIYIIIKKGALASTPVAPELVRTGDMWELALADISIPAGLTEITQANITDNRLNTDLCGIVHGTVNQVDTTTIFNQYMAWFEEMSGERTEDFDTWVDARKQEFDDWFLSILDILDENVAGNLLLKINKLEHDVGNAYKHITRKTDKDANGIFKTVRIYRPDDTLFMESVLTGGESPKYEQRIVRTYDANGLSVLTSVTYVRTYDSDDALIEEVIL